MNVHSSSTQMVTNCVKFFSFDEEAGKKVDSHVVLFQSAFIIPENRSMKCAHSTKTNSLYWTMFLKRFLPVFFPL